MMSCTSLLEHATNALIQFFFVFYAYTSSPFLKDSKQVVVPPHRYQHQFTKPKLSRTMQEQKSAFTVVVTGDVTMDWNIAHRANALRKATDWTGEAKSNMNRQYGSAALLADLITTMTTQSENGLLHSVEVISHNIPKQTSVTLFDPRYVHSYAVWAQYRDKDPKKTSNSRFDLQPLNTVVFKI